MALERGLARWVVRFCRRDSMLVTAMWECTNSERMPAVAAAIMLSASQSVEASIKAGGAQCTQAPETMRAGPGTTRG